MRTTLRAVVTSALLLATTAAPLLAQAEHASGGPNLLAPNTGLMFWTLLIFVVLLFVLSKFAFGPITAAVEARELALEEALDAAKRDRAEAAKLLAEHKAQLDGARAEAQRLITSGREMGERVRAEMLEQTKQQQQELLARARRDIESEKELAIGELRREAVDLAIAGAAKVIERNLDDQQNRRLVEGFLATLKPATR
jgi:F-type H+-transporting ATPase subunit b